MNLYDLFHLVLYVSVILLVKLVVFTVFPPLNFPRNIPTIPFYVSFLGTYTNLDQRDIYKIYLKDKLEKHGAVKIYFASRWNILVSRPSYLVEMFRNEDIYAKSGNHVKIPYSVLSDYTGDNVISAHGPTWKMYRQVLTSAIQFPDLQPISNNVELFLNFIENSMVERIGYKSPCTVLVSDAIQRYSLANLGECLLGIDFKLFKHKSPEINKRLSFVKSQIFKPLYMNFPFLDILPIPSRKVARQAVSEFRDYFCNLVKESQRSNQDPNTVGAKLVAALNEGSLTEMQFNDNAMITMIAGHENPQLLLNSLLYVLGSDYDYRNDIREELRTGVKPEDCVSLNSFIFETLRMYPPLGQIINRCTTRDVMLGGEIRIPKGIYVGYNNFATGRDSTVWEYSEYFVPKRWGKTIEEVNRNYSLAKSSARLPAFHGGKRACLGEKFALNEARQVIAKLITLYDFDWDRDWEDKLTPGGPVSPVNLKLEFSKPEFIFGTGQ